MDNDTREREGSPSEALRMHHRVQRIRNEKGRLVVIISKAIREPD